MYILYTLYTLKQLKSVLLQTSTHSLWVGQNYNIILIISSCIFTILCTGIFHPQVTNNKYVCHYYITIIFTLLHLNLYWKPVIVVITVGILLMTTVVILGVICCIVQLRKKRWSGIWNYNNKFILYFYNFLYRSILSTRYNR